MTSEERYGLRKYTVSQRAMEILEEQGYVILLHTENVKEIKTWEIVKHIGNELPVGAKHIIDANQVTRYGNIFLIEKDR